MKSTAKGLTALAGALLMACASPPSEHRPNRTEQAVATMGALYDATRTLLTTNGQQQYALVPDADLVQASETLLLHYSRTNDEVTRIAAGCRLAHLGTMAAWERALEVARTEKSPEARAGLWCAIAELLQPPVRWPAPTFGPLQGQTTNSSVAVSQVLSSPEFQVVISCGYNPASDLLLPPGLSRDDVAEEIIAQYRRDDGSWPVVYADKIPFVPFSTRRGTVTMTLRGEIAESLMSTARGNGRILEAFRSFSEDADEAVSGPAKLVVEVLSQAPAELPNLGRRP